MGTSLRSTTVPSPGGLENSFSSSGTHVQDNPFSFGGRGGNWVRRSYQAPPFRFQMVGISSRQNHQIAGVQVDGVGRFSGAAENLHKA